MQHGAESSARARVAVNLSLPLLRCGCMSLVPHFIPLDQK